MRKNWPTFFMDMAYLLAEQSTCLRRKVGAVAVLDKRVLSQGFNGAPSGMAHCLDIGCFRQQYNIPSGERHELCRAVHAEANTIVHAVRSGIDLKGAELYCTTYPCSLCAKLIAAVGFSAVYYHEGYPDEMSAEYLHSAKIDVKTLPGYIAPSSKK